MVAMEFLVRQFLRNGLGRVGVVSVLFRSEHRSGREGAHKLYEENRELVNGEITPTNLYQLIFHMEDAILISAPPAAVSRNSSYQSYMYSFVTCYQSYMYSFVTSYQSYMYVFICNFLSELYVFICNLLSELYVLICNLLSELCIHL